jgi:glycine cleavage system H protein
MEGFTYVNLFDTKGIEYLIVIAFLLLIIPFWKVLNRPVKVAGRVHQAAAVLSPGMLSVPGGLFYSKNHTWAHLERSGSAVVGIDDFISNITGSVKAVIRKEPGEQVKKGELIAELVQDGKSLGVFSPVSGKVNRLNHALDEEPGLLGSDPCGNGWLCSIEPSDWKGETSPYLFARQATEWLGEEVARLRDFLALRADRYMPAPSMVALQDGGELTGNLLSEMPADLWKEFENEFLNQGA